MRRHDRLSVSTHLTLTSSQTYDFNVTILKVYKQNSVTMIHFEIFCLQSVLIKLCVQIGLL